MASRWLSSDSQNPGNLGDTEILGLFTNCQSFGFAGYLQVRLPKYPEKHQADTLGGNPLCTTPKRRSKTAPRSLPGCIGARTSPAQATRKLPRASSQEFVPLGEGPAQAMLEYDYETLGEDLSARSEPEGSPARGWQPDPDDPWPAPPGPQELASGIEHRYVGSLKKKRPLVLVGGFGANGLAQVDRQGRRLYLGRQVWPPFHFHPGSGDWAVHGVAEVVRADLAPTGLVIGQYEPLLAFLQQELGYQLHKNFYLFPYRWTDSSLESGRRLAGFLRHQFGPDQPVDVICHSLGGLVARAAGLLFDAPLERVVYMACPFFGAGKSYFNLHPNHSVQLVDNLLVNRLLDRLAAEGSPLSGSDLTGCFQKMQSLFELLPDSQAFQLGLAPVVVRSAPLTWQEVYLRQPTTAFPPELHARIESAMQFKDSLGLAMPGRTYLTLYSESHTTLGRADQLFGVSGFAVFGSLYDPSGGGDGTVPALSGQGPGPALCVHGRHLALPNHRLSFYWLARFLEATEE